MENDAISRSALMSATFEKLMIGKQVDGVPVLRETITAQELDRLLTAAPALDVQPVVHARWKQHKCTSCDEVCVTYKSADSIVFIETPC